MSRTVEQDKLIHKSYLFEVRRLQLGLPNGETIHRDLIRHPGAALVLPVLADGSIVIISNDRYAVGKALWELPCGTLEDGEAPEICAARELAEESGYTAGRLVKLGEFYSCPGYNDEIIHAYLAGDLKEGEQHLEGYEEISVAVLPDAQVRRMAAENEIEDGKTLAALGMYWLQKNKC